MDKVYQVFVSSTFSDLKHERLQVSNTLAKAGYMAAGMELFPATDQQQLEYIKRIIDRSDYYVVIVGGRYGSLADENTSFTEKEFEYALSRNIPVLAFLHYDPRKLPVEKTDEDPVLASLLERFRKRLSSGRIVEFWKDTNDLCTQVVIAVTNAVNLTPGVGWVRGDQAVDPKVLQETERLRLENAELRTQLANSTPGELTFDPGLLGPDDTIELNVAQADTRHVCKLEIGRIFLSLYDAILAEQQEGDMTYYLGHAAAELSGLKVGGDMPFYTDMQDVFSLRNQFEALGLIQPVSQKRNIGPPVIVWSATEKGRKFASMSNALKKVASASK
jgi:hypothetical protein